MYRSTLRRFPRGIVACTALIVAQMGCGTGVKPTPAQAPAVAAGQTTSSAPSISLPAQGTPAELLAFVAELESRPADGASREEVLAVIRDRATVFVQAADRILSQVRPGEPFHAQAATLKLEGLSRLGRLGDERASEALAAYAESLVDDPDAALARQAWRQLIDLRSREAFEAGAVDQVFGLVQAAVEVLAADLTDGESASLCMKLAGRVEQMEGADARAIEAYRLVGDLAEKSPDPQIHSLAEICAGAERRLSLPGRPMEIRGTLLDGTPFDPRSLTGKVVIVDFWATWCRPCIEELPNVLAQYEKYHDRGLEVVGVSLDEDREAVSEFIMKTGLPWPVIIGTGEESGWNLPLAREYGISGIPQLILIGRDGNVIMVNAQGEALGERLAEIFKDAG